MELNFRPWRRSLHPLEDALGWNGAPRRHRPPGNEPLEPCWKKIYQLWRVAMERWVRDSRNRLCNKQKTRSNPLSSSNSPHVWEWPIQDHSSKQMKNKISCSKMVAKTYYALCRWISTWIWMNIQRTKPTKDVETWRDGSIHDVIPSFFPVLSQKKKKRRGWNRIGETGKGK